MTDVETQASKRTVIAFISGLLIGGLFVWVFSATPGDSKKADTGNTTDSAVESKTEPTNGDSKDTSATGASLTVTDQAAGTQVALGDTTFPEGIGWIVIRDHQDGMQGGVLGAARYDTALGLKPTAVDLLRGTVAGNTYEALFYTDAGASTFDLSEDMPIEGASAVFKAN